MTPALTRYFGDKHNLVIPIMYFMLEFFLFKSQICDLCSEITQQVNVSSSNLFLRQFPLMELIGLISPAAAKIMATDE